MNPMLREMLLTGLRRAMTIYVSAWAGYLVAKGVFTRSEADAYLAWIVPLVAAAIIDSGVAIYNKYIARRVKLILSASDGTLTLDEAKTIERGTRKTGSAVELNGQIITAEDVPSVKTPDNAVAPMLYLNTGDGTPGSATPAA